MSDRTKSRNDHSEAPSAKAREAIQRHDERVQRAINTAAVESTNLSLALLRLEVDEATFNEAMNVLEARGTSEEQAAAAAEGAAN